MARGDADIAVTPALLDRLIDLDPSASSDPPATRNQSVRQLKISLRRDLEWLLNTRRIAEEAPEAYQQVCHSLYHYGLADVTSMALNSPRDKNRLLRMVESILTDFEPRLSGVRVSANNPNPIRVHPNGREIAYVATTRANEVSVLENFLPAAKSAK